MACGPVMNGAGSGGGARWHAAHSSSAEERRAREEARVVQNARRRCAGKGHTASSVETSAQSGAANDGYRRKYRVVARVETVPIMWEFVNVSR